VRQLHFSKGIFVDFAVYLHFFLWLWKSSIHHVLVVLDKTHFSLEFRIEMVLTFREAISLFFHSCCVWFLFVAKPIPFLFILSQTVIESAFAVGRVVHNSKTTRVIANVRVTASTVVNIDYWLGMNMSERVSWCFLSCNKSTNSFYLAGAGARTETSIITVDIRISASSISTVVLFLWSII